MTNAATTTSHTTCRRCGRPLTSPRSIREAQTNGGYGRGCAAKIADTVAVETPAIAEQAAELIEDGGVVRVTGAIFLAVSTDGSVLYEVCPVVGSCSCKAGQYGRRCFHLAAAEAVSGLTAPACVAREVVEVATPADPFAVFATAA